MWNEINDSTNEGFIERFPFQSFMQGISCCTRDELRLVWETPFWFSTFCTVNLWIHVRLAEIIHESGYWRIRIKNGSIWRQPTALRGACVLCMNELSLCLTAVSFTAIQLHATLSYHTNVEIRSASFARLLYFVECWMQFWRGCKLRCLRERVIASDNAQPHEPRAL